MTLGLERAEDIQLLEPTSLYAIDSWLDTHTRDSRHLAIAVQLRGAISGEMQVGQAEAGAAVLLGSTSAGSRGSTSLVYAHRPTRSDIESVAQGLANPLALGHRTDGNIESVWNAGLTEPLANALGSLDGPANDAPVIELARTIGAAGVAAPWLALALAAEKTKGSSGAQLILDQQDGNLVAMVCRANT